ncbi:TonB-dependent receptor [Marivirga arenosa]|uniref:TonB-dependent receptor n=1 Tax=Marivirga arenosa TaxID=3059076 RepID=A0AA51N5Z5_9BACT|nr:TonB-dependent receptor [Marivirga sp. ABR2-2]WMN06752.1 TonB-dependent receptor [Marivirga sp. ABR2-2]
MIKRIVFYIVFILPFTSFAQKQSSISLPALLDSLESKYQVNFSYVDEHVAHLKLPYPVSHQSLDDYLQWIESKTPLKINKLNAQFYTISVRNDQHSDLICLHVFDKQNRASIENCIIIYGKKVFYTDSLGNYCFKIRDAEVDNLIIRHLNYESQQLSIKSLNREKVNKIGLQSRNTMLKEVQTKYYLTEGINKKSDGTISINVPNTSLLPGLSEQDVLFSIQKLPGIQSLNERVSDINVRGGSNDQNLLLWEGARMYQTGHFFGLISALNPYLINQVELTKNGTSPLYPGGISSVLNIKMENEINQSFEGAVGLNMLNANSYWKIPLTNKIAINLSARRSIADVLNTPTFDNYFERAFANTEVSQFVQATDTLRSNQYFNFHDYSAKLLYDINSRDKLRVSYLNMYNTISYEESALNNGIIDSKTSELSQQNWIASAELNRKWSQQLNTKIHLSASSYDLNSINYDIPNDQILRQQNEVLDLNLTLMNSQKLKTGLQYDYGYQFNEVGVLNFDEINKPAFSRNVKEVLQTHSIINDIRWSFFQGKSIAKVGLRMNYFNKFNQYSFEPRLTFNQQLNDAFDIELLAELKTQTTTQIIDFQTDFLAVEKRRWVLVNDQDLPIISSRQISIGGHYRKNGWLISAEGYWKDVKNISSSSQGFQNQYRFIRSSGNYTSKGIDILINKQMDDLNAWLNHSISNTEYNFSEFTPSSFPSNFDVPHAGGMGISYQLQQLEFALGLNYHSGRAFSRIVEGQEVVNDSILYQTVNSYRLPFYMRPDLSIRYTYNLRLNQKLQFAISLWNFINYENIINQYYLLDSDNTIQEIRQQALKFTPNLSIQWSL